MIIATSLLTKSYVFERFRPTLKRKVGVFKFLRFKSVFEKLRFRDGPVWMVGITGEINSSAA